MSNILSITDFDGYRALAQNDKIELIETFLSQSEKKYLTDLLGAQLYTEFKAALDAGSPAQKWVDLRDGATIVHDDNTIIFAGVKEMLIGFTYYDISRRLNIFLSSVGALVEETANGSKASNAIFEAEKYNEGIEIYGYDWALYFCEDQSENKLNNYHIYFSQKSLVNSKINGTAYNFIKYSNEAIAETYENWIFTYKFPTNFLGL